MATSLLCSGSTLLLHLRHHHQRRAAIISRSSSSSSSAASRVSAERCCAPPRVSAASPAPSPSPADISEYLLAKQDWRKTPKCADYHSGAICIRRTHDGGLRGRGVYAIRDIPKGELLMLGNPIASAHDDSDSTQLFARICEVIRRDPVARRRFFLLSGREKEHREAPPIELFGPAMAMADSPSSASSLLHESQIESPSTASTTSSAAATSSASASSSSRSVCRVPSNSSSDLQDTMDAVASSSHQDSRPGVANDDDDDDDDDGQMPAASGLLNKSQIESSSATRASSSSSRSVRQVSSNSSADQQDTMDPTASPHRDSRPIPHHASRPIPHRDSRPIVVDADADDADGDDGGQIPPPSSSFDYKHVHDIMRLNSFQAKLYSSDGHPEVKVSAMYLLPAMMNHSCLRNASRVFVGEAMAFYAARDIRGGEEITVEYCDALLPLAMREALLGSRFRCRCPRCELERSVAPDLRKCGETFVALYAEAYEELREMLTTGTRTSFPASECLRDAYQEVREKIGAFGHLTKLQKQWILAGFSSAFLANWFRLGHSTGFSQPSHFVTPLAVELLDAMMASVPGVEHTLTFATLLSLVAQREDPRLSRQLFDKAKQECVAAYGKQRDDVITALTMRAAQRAPF